MLANSQFLKTTQGIAAGHLMQVAGLAWATETLKKNPDHPQADMIYHHRANPTQLLKMIVSKTPDIDRNRVIAGLREEFSALYNAQLGDVQPSGQNALLMAAFDRVLWNNSAESELKSMFNNAFRTITEGVPSLSEVRIQELRAEEIETEQTLQEYRHRFQLGG